MDSTNPLCIEEILQNIFDFLPLRDKKNATLVNKLWNEVCNRRKFTSEQVFFLPNMYDFITVTDVLSHCKREALNLMFNQSRIDDDSVLLWKTCGDRIEYLYFHDCIFRNGVLPEILKYCVNLKYLTLQRVQFFKDGKSDRFVEPRHTYWSKRYDAGPVASVLLPETNMVHEKLTQLYLDSRVLRLRSSDLQRFSSAFPQLQVVKMNMVTDDDLKPKESSTELPNLSLLFELLATKQKQIQYIDMQLTTKHAEDYITFDFVMLKRDESLDYVLELDSGVASLEPYFKFSETLPPIPYFKFCSSIIVNARERLPFTDTHDFNLEIRLARFILNNPQLQRLELFMLTSSIPERMAHLLAALILSHLQYIHLNVYAFNHGIYQSIEEALHAYNLTANATVQRLKIRSNVDAFSALCMKYFQNVKHLSIMPVGANADDVFKYQKNLKKLSIALVDKPFVPLPSVVSVESLEVLKIRGSILSFLSAYQFPNLKYLFFTFYTKQENPQFDLETQNEPVEETMGALLPLFGLELDKSEEQELQAQGSSTEASDESNATQPLSGPDFDKGEEQELQAQGSSTEASDDSNATQPLSGPDLDEGEEQGLQAQGSSTEASDESNATQPLSGPDLDKGEEQDSQSQGSSSEALDKTNVAQPLLGQDLGKGEEQEPQSQNSSPEASDEEDGAHRLFRPEVIAALMLLFQQDLDEDEEQDSRPPNSSTEATDESNAAHPQLGLDLDKGEEQELRPQNSSAQASDESNAAQPLLGLDLDKGEEQESSQDSSPEASDDRNEAHWFILKLHRIMPVLSKKLPNLEGLSFNDLSYYHLNATDYSLFFELGQNCPNLRYVSMRDKNGKIKEADIKAEMLQYMPKCPSLRAIWVETSNCRICRHFNVISRKFEFSDYYSNRSMNTYLNGVNLKQFYGCEH